MKKLKGDGTGMEAIQEPVLTPVSVVIPAYNEESAVGAEVEAIRRVLCSHGITHEIIVVDDGSEDRTGEEALQARARSEPGPRGSR